MAASGEDNDAAREVVELPEAWQLWRAGCFEDAVDALHKSSSQGEDVVSYAAYCAWLLAFCALREAWRGVAFFLVASAAVIGAATLYSLYGAVCAPHALSTARCVTAAASLRPRGDWYDLSRLRASVPGAALASNAAVNVSRRVVGTAVPLFWSAATLGRGVGLGNIATVTSCLALAGLAAAATYTLRSGAGTAALQLALYIVYLAPAALRAALEVSGRDTQQLFSTTGGLAAVPWPLRVAGVLSLSLAARWLNAAKGIASGFATLGSTDVIFGTLRWMVAFWMRRRALKLRRYRSKLVVLVLALTLAGDAILLKCLGGLHTVPITHRMRLLPMSKTEGAHMGRVHYNADAPRGVVIKEGKVEPRSRVSVVRGEGDPSMRSLVNDVAKLEEVTDKVLAAVEQFSADAQLFSLSPSLDASEKDVNAGAVHGGRLLFNLPLVRKANKDELACVVGHEATHILMLHSLEKTFWRSFAGDLFDDFICITTGLTCSLEHSGFYSAALAHAFSERVIESPLSMDAEFEADLFGMYFAALAGFNPERCARMFEPGGLLYGRNGYSWADGLEKLAGSHPEHDTRARFMRKWFEGGGGGKRGTLLKWTKAGKNSTLELKSSVGTLNLRSLASAAPSYVERNVYLLVAAHLAFLMAAFAAVVSLDEDDAVQRRGGLAPAASVVEHDVFMAKCANAWLTLLSRVPFYLFVLPIFIRMAESDSTNFTAALVFVAVVHQLIEPIKSTVLMVQNQRRRAERRRERAAATALPTPAGLTPFAARFAARQHMPANAANNDTSRSPAEAAAAEEAVRVVAAVHAPLQRSLLAPADSDSPRQRPMAAWAAALMAEELSPAQSAETTETPVAMENAASL